MVSQGELTDQDLTTYFSQYGEVKDSVVSTSQHLDAHPSGNCLRFHLNTTAAGHSHQNCT